jgi:hypothetical protein
MWSNLRVEALIVGSHSIMITRCEMPLMQLDIIHNSIITDHRLYGVDKSPVLYSRLGYEFPLNH